MLSAQLMIILDMTVVNIALPHIQADLHFSATSLSWVLNAYTLTSGGLLLLGGRAGDILGRRRMFLAGIGLFTVASLARPPSSSRPPDVSVYAFSTQDRPVAEKCRLSWICGSAMFTTVMSRMIMSWAPSMMARAIPGRP